MRRLVLMGTCSFLVGALTGTGIAQRQSQALEAPYPLPQPSGWVAFTADMIQTGLDGPPIRGRFYRSSTGSTRTELIRERDGTTLTRLHIRNFALGVYYRNMGTNVWLRGELPEQARRPMPLSWSSKAPGLMPYPHKVALLNGQDGSLSATEGLDAWIQSNAEGTTRVMAPALNFFAVVHTNVAGVRTIYRNIVMTDVPSSMFELPPGSVIEDAPQRGAPQQ